MKSSVRLLCASLCLASAVPLMAGPNEILVTGSGMITVDGTHRNFSFTAHADEDGVARGRAQLHNRSSHVTLYMDIDCVRVEGNTAWVSGTHWKSKGEDYEGLEFWFKVVDNGEGSTEPRDQITLVSTFFAGGIPCTQDFVLSPNTDLHEIEGGNIQIHER